MELTEKDLHCLARILQGCEYADGTCFNAVSSACISSSAMNWRKRAGHVCETAYTCLRGVIGVEILEEKVCDCALQHIKAFQEQGVKGVTADFGEPCQNCIHREVCEFDWFSILSQIRSHSNVKISRVVQEPNLQLDSIQCGISQDTDTHNRMDKKSL